MNTRIARAGILAILIFVSAISFGQVEWMGVYLQGQKIGFNYSKHSEILEDGSRLKLTESRMEIGTQMLGSTMRIVADSSVWVKDGLIIRSYYKMSSSGRTLEVNARYTETQIFASMVTDSGEESKVITIPAGKKIVTDSIELLESGAVLMPGQVHTALVFSPDTLEVVEVKYLVKEPEEIETKVGRVRANVFFVDDPRAPSTFYLSPKGDLIKMVGPMGLEMIPETEQEAKAFSGTASIDLASASRVVPDKNISWSAKKVKLNISGISLAKTPSDDRQKVSPNGDSWIVELQLDKEPNPNAQIVGVQAGMEDWLKADIRVPVDDPEIKSTVAKIVGNEKTVLGAVKKIHAYVYESMGVNAGIGVMRDAREILKSKEGVCRDHAILAGTLLRSAGIPTRFSNGLVLYMGAYYYHAWVEYWDGTAWIGLDTTRPDLRLGTGYIKTTQGTVGQALQGFLLDGAKITVIEQ